jgi:hypothetical protein
MILSLQNNKIQTSPTLNGSNAYFGRRGEVCGRSARDTVVAKRLDREGNRDSSQV